MGFVISILVPLLLVNLSLYIENVVKNSPCWCFLFVKREKKNQLAKIAFCSFTFVRQSTKKLQILTSCYVLLPEEKIRLKFLLIQKCKFLQPIQAKSRQLLLLMNENF